jgi:peptidyl-prolyl cis-trans isomerase D
MLQQIREHLTGWVAMLILGAIALSFVFFGIDFSSGGANVAMRVNGEKVQRFEYENVVRNNIARFQQAQPDAFTPETEAAIRAQSIDALVNQTLIDQVTAERGYRISDSRLQKEIRNVPDFQIGGEFDEQVYFDALKSVGRNPASFEAQLRQDLERQQMQAAFEVTSFVTADELAARIALVNQTRTIDYLQLPVGLAMEDVVVTDDDLLARYEARPDAYTEPERVDLQFIEMKLEDVAAAIEVSEDDILAAYESGLESERFRTPEERKARHILIASTDDVSAADAREQAQSLLEQLADGADFAALAAEYSDDTLSGPDGGDLGWIAPGTLDEALVDAVFATDVGALAGPVQTSFGFHVLRVDEIRGGDLTTLDEVREELRAELQQSQADNLFIDRGEELADLVFQNSTSLAPAADALDLQIQSVDGVTARSGTGVAANAALREAAFSFDVLEDGLNSGVIELEFGHLVVVRVVDRTPARLRPFEDVRDSVESVVRVEKAREEVRARGEAVIARLRDGESLEAVAEELGDLVAPVMDVSLNRQSRDVPTQLVQDVFAAPTPPPAKAVLGGVSLLVGDYVVYRLREVSDGELPEALSSQIAGQLAREGAIREFGAYLGTLKSNANIFVSRTLQDTEQAQ